MQTELKCLWDKCVTFHGHGCGGLAVGFRVVLYETNPKETYYIVSG
jgi:formylmethanofuran dehydrogenase subunit E